jgi:hypothetical protein
LYHLMICSQTFFVNVHKHTTCIKGHLPIHASPNYLV